VQLYLCRSHGRFHYPTSSNAHHSPSSYRRDFLGDAMIRPAPSRALRVMTYCYCASRDCTCGLTTRERAHFLAARTLTAKLHGRKLRWRSYPGCTACPCRVLYLSTPDLARHRSSVSHGLSARSLTHRGPAFHWHVSSVVFRSCPAMAIDCFRVWRRSS